MYAYCKNFELPESLSRRWEIINDAGVYNNLGFFKPEMFEKWF